MAKNRKGRCFALVFGILFGIQKGYCQQVLYKVHGTVPYGSYAISVSYIGDINQDGVSDFAVGQPFYSVSNPANSQGRLVVYSGKTGAPIYSLTGRDKIGFGAVVKAAGFVDADSIPDFVVVSNGYVNGTACVSNPAGEKAEITFHSGVNGNVIRTIITPFFQGGAALEIIDDLNGDSIKDVVVGQGQCSCSFNNPCNQCKGCVKVYSGGSGAQLYSFTDPNFNTGLGNYVGVVGDINNDQKKDYIVGGYASAITRIFSGANGNVIRTTTGINIPFFHSSSPFLSIGDVNADGRADYAIGRGTGGVTVYSGASGAVLYIIPPSTSSIYEYFGVNLRMTDDKNGDGLADFAVAANYWQDAGTPYVRVVSALNGATIYSFFGPQFSAFGSDFDASADITGDGAKDFLIGAYSESSLGMAHNGVLYSPVNPESGCKYQMIKKALVCL